MNPIIENIINRKVSCYFVSPHLDDAVLSCGSLMEYLSRNGVPVSVPTIFTKAGSFHTLSARAFMKQCGIDDAFHLFACRRKEDKKILESIGVSWAHLGFVDALWRQKRSMPFANFVGKILPELVHLYPTYRFHITSGNISDYEKGILSEIAEKILRIARPVDDAIFFFPLGLGKHIDHVITHEVGLQFSGDVVFYADFPYNLTDTPDDEAWVRKGFTKLAWDKEIDRKHELIRQYETQPLFSGSIPAIPEVFHVPNRFFKDKV